MRGDDFQQDAMFSYLSPEQRVPADHPLRPIRQMVDRVLKGLSPCFQGMYNMQQAARVSDYTAFLYLGELVEFDEAAKIFTNPNKKATEDYITGRYG